MDITLQDSTNLKRCSNNLRGSEGDNLDKEYPGDNRSTSMTLRRNVYTQHKLDDMYAPKTAPAINQNFKCEINRNKIFTRVLDYFPLISIVNNYTWRTELLHDVISGTSTFFLQMPMGIALALLATLPPAVGLYTTFFPVMIYLVFGTCRHMSVGTSALLSLLTASVVQRELAAVTQITVSASTQHVNNPPVAAIIDATFSSSSQSDVIPSSTSSTTTSTTTDFSVVMSEEQIYIYKVDIATCLAFTSGVILLAFGVLRLGSITSYLSTSVLEGFTEAAGIHIFTSQVPKMLHIHVPPVSGKGRLLRTYVQITEQLENTNLGDLGIGIISIVIILSVTFVNDKYKKKLKMPIPIHLILVIVATVISHFADFHTKFGIAVVGHVTTGFALPRPPAFTSMLSLATDSCIVAIMGYACNISIAKLMSREHNYRIDDDQELVAAGLCNVIGAFFSCMPNCTALPRSMLLSLTGARSTINAIFTAIPILAVIMVGGGLIAPLPVAVLAAMIMTAVKDLILQVGR